MPRRTTTTTTTALTPTNPPTPSAPLLPTSLLPIAPPKIHNIVCGINLNCRLDLKTIAPHARNAEYAPKRFQAAVLKLRDPRATALAFTSGKVQILGTKSVADARLAARKIARVLQKLGFRVRPDGFQVQNIVANADVRCAVRLEGLAARHHRHATYEPEIFPGLIYRIEQVGLKLTALVFARGKVVMLGAKRVGDLDRALALLYPVLREFPVDPPVEKVS